MILQEIVIASNEPAKDIHKGLFHLDEKCYILLSNNSTILCEPSTIYSLNKNLERIHLALNWTDIVRFCTWSDSPTEGEILLLLKKIGLTDEELRPFKGSIKDILPYLYFGKRFDILRRLCSEAKKKLEKDLRTVRVNCHLIYEETGSIIASSL